MRNNRKDLSVPVLHPDGACKRQQQLAQLRSDDGSSPALGNGFGVRHSTLLSDILSTTPHANGAVVVVGEDSNGAGLPLATCTARADFDDSGCVDLSDFTALLATTGSVPEWCIACTNPETRRAGHGATEKDPYSGGVGRGKEPGAGVPRRVSTASLPGD
jgi:hypothetical protein